MSGSKRSRRHFTTEQKVAILKRHMVDKVPVSDLCNEHGSSPACSTTGSARPSRTWQPRSRPRPRRGAQQAREGAGGQDQGARGQARQEGPRDRRDLRGVRATKKRAWGALTGRWVPHDTRDTVVDFVRVWSDKTEIAAERFVAWIGIARGKFFDWKKRYGKANEHNGLVPRDHWLARRGEAQASSTSTSSFPLEGYRRLTFMMLDQDVVAVSPSSVYRVLAGAGLLDRWNKKPSKKGTGFVQPLRAPRALAHRHLLPQPRRHVLLPVLDPRRRQPRHRALGDPRVDDRGRRRVHPAARPRAVSRRAAAHHLGQRPAVHRQGLQGVHPPHRHDPRPDLALLPAVQRQDRALAQDPQGRRHPAGAARRRSRRPARSWPASSSTTTPSGCTAPSATSPRPTSSPVAVPSIWAERDARLEAAREVRRLRRAELHQEAA